MPRTITGTRTAIGSARTAAGARTVIGTSTKASHAIAEPTPLEEFETGWAYVSGGGTVTQNDPTHFRTGTGAIKLVCDNVTTGSGNLFAGKTVSYNFATLKPSSISVWVYCDFTSDWTTNQCYVSLNFFTAGFAGSIISQTTYVSLSQGWQLITFDRGSFTLAGDATWGSTFTTFRLKVGAIASQTVTCWVDSLLLNYYARPFVMINFDDAFDTVHSAAYPILSAAGLVGNVYMVSSFIDDGTHLTTAHLNALYTAGWDIGSHTANHNNLKSASVATITSEWATCKAALDAAGWTRASMHGCWPNGGTGVNTDAGAAAGGMVSIHGAQNCLNTPPVIDNQYKLSNHTVLALTETPSVLLGLVDRAINGGYSIQLTFHDIVAGAPATDSQFKAADLQTFVTGLLARINGGRLGNCTWSEYYSFTQGGGRPKVK